MTIQRLSHIGICVSDLDTSVRFYQQALGFTELSRLAVRGDSSERLLDIAGGKLEAVYLERDGTRIELLYYPEAGHLEAESPRPMNKVGFTHLSLRVDDLDAAVNSVAEYGGHHLADTEVGNPEWLTRAVFVTDPDGLRIELIQAPGDPNALPGDHA